MLAIEFALFGLQPGQRGSVLLRNGAETGKVSIELEVDGKNILVERTLKKSKTVSQDYCSITIDGEKEEIAVTELKNKVLEILDYPKEFSKKQNLLYKFTVYTPQEQMKQIILQDANSRLNTLRHVFGIDKYKKILENISIVTSKLREEKRLKEGMTLNIEQDKANLEEKKQNIESKKISLSSSEAELILKVEQRKNIENEKKEIDLKIQEKNKLEQEVAKTKILITTKNQSILDNKQIIEDLMGQIQESSDIKFDESKIKQLEENLNLIKQQKQEFNDKNMKINSEIYSLTSKNDESEITKNNLANLEMCPTCLQDVDPLYKSNVKNKLDSDMTNNVKKIQELTIEKQDLSKKLSEFDLEISTIEKEINHSNILKVKLQTIQEKKLRLENLQKQNVLLEKDISLLNEQNETLKNSVFELSKFDSIFQAKQKHLEESQREEKASEIKVAELKKEIDLSLNQIQELTKRIETTEEIKKKLFYLEELENWLNKKFTPVISYIEKNVMIRLKSEFSELFSKWFSMLVSDNFNVRLSDDFTPIISQQDYEIDYAYLSGGERTAIALAYRLALNQVINSLLSKIKTKDIVILDEPTDGFSDSQLDKMRGVLEELEMTQLIIVSHEQKIEGFVDNVIKFRKEQGISVKE